MSNEMKNERIKMMRKWDEIVSEDQKAQKVTHALISELWKAEFIDILSADDKELVFINIKPGSPNQGKTYSVKAEQLKKWSYNIYLSAISRLQMKSA
jgi:hypothetical protein